MRGCAGSCARWPIQLAAQFIQHSKREWATLASHDSRNAEGIRLRKICFLTLAAPALLLNQVPIAVAQNLVALSPQHEWVAGVADEAFPRDGQTFA
jgi:hypothetical protein